MFVERQNYRLRRLADAARFLPIMGVALLLLPVLRGEAVATSGGALYILAVWLGLILAAALIGRRLGRGSPER